MTTSTPYAPARLAREARVHMRRLRRRASLAEAVVRTAVLVAAMATLAAGLSGVLRSGSAEVASRLDATTTVASMR
jgi:hypothetical protein